MDRSLTGNSVCVSVCVCVCVCMHVCVYLCVCVLTPPCTAVWCRNNTNKALKEKEEKFSIATYAENFSVSVYPQTTVRA